MALKDDLLAEAALILEQEGWLTTFYAHETNSTRLRDFSDRYKEWQEKVDSARNQDPTMWPQPPDNS